MKLSHELAKMFEEELEKTLSKEQEKKEYLPQEAFENCESRSLSLLHGAFKRVANTMTLAIIEHRETEHEEDYKTERAITEIQTTEADQKVARSFWWLPS